MVSRELWNLTKPHRNPFLSWEFFHALSESQSIGPASGWNLKYLQEENALLYWFEKSHSYGEYIFDWSWAEAYERYGLDYYPKLTSMVPFSPVTTGHFLMKDFDSTRASSLLNSFQKNYLQNDFSSAHFLFLSPEEIPVFQNAGYLIRESIQYHFFNQSYESFDQFLSMLRTKKAKNIRAERKVPVTIKKITGDSLTKDHARRMYRYYISTIENKNSFDYLNENFFLMLFSDLKENVLFIEAYEDQNPIAGALFLYDQEKLYGRYWGALKYVHHLHFELCYYQGIDFVIERKLKVFEAGAQGEHKILRGFRPVKIFSAHTLKNELFRKAIRDFIDKEKLYVQRNIKELSRSLPFKELSE